MFRMQSINLSLLTIVLLIIPYFTNRKIYFSLWMNPCDMGRKWVTLKCCELHSIQRSVIAKYARDTRYRERERKEKLFKTLKALCKSFNKITSSTCFNIKLKSRCNFLNPLTYILAFITRGLFIMTQVTKIKRRKIMQNFFN